MRMYSKLFRAILFMAVASNNQVFSFVTRSLVPNGVRTALAVHAVADTEPPTSTVAKSKLPTIIQGGMGVRISSWELAREVAKKDGLGVVSGTAMDVIFVRTLQDGKSLFAWCMH